MEQRRHLLPNDGKVALERTGRRPALLERFERRVLQGQEIGIGGQQRRRWSVALGKVPCTRHPLAPGVFHDANNLLRSKIVALVSPSDRCRQPAWQLESARSCARSTTYLAFLDESV